MKPTLSTAAASGTVSLAFVVVLQWLLMNWNISMPADVASALSTLLAAGVHWFVARQKTPSSNPTEKDA